MEGVSIDRKTFSVYDITTFLHANILMPATHYERIHREEGNGGKFVEKMTNCDPVTIHFTSSS